MKEICTDGEGVEPNMDKYGQGEKAFDGMWTSVFAAELPTFDFYRETLC